MIALTSLEKLYEARHAGDQIKTQTPGLYEDLIHLVSLTRQLQFRYQYLGSLLTDENTEKSAPVHAKQSVISLYLQEVNDFRSSEYAEVIKKLFLNYKDCGYNNICLLLLGKSPEELKGVQS